LEGIIQEMKKTPQARRKDKQEQRVQELLQMVNQGRTNGTAERRAD
jgi:hypothetical protein